VDFEFRNQFRAADGYGRTPRTWRTIDRALYMECLQLNPDGFSKEILWKSRSTRRYSTNSIRRKAPFPCQLSTLVVHLTIRQQVAVRFIEMYAVQPLVGHCCKKLEIFICEDSCLE
jgi:hypothetical protein